MEDSELTSHAPNETSICLSGGGLRAASFSLGVLQVLQERRGLLSGPRPATYLAAVSGGAYIGAAAILNCAVRARDPGIYRDSPPLARGSAEEAHILGNADYAAKRRLRLAGLAVLNFLSLVFLFVWSGFFLADVAAIAIDAFPEYGRWSASADLGPAVVPLLALTASVTLLLRWRYSDNPSFAHGLAILPLCAVVLLCPIMLARSDEVVWMSDGKIALALGSVICGLITVTVGLAHYTGRIGLLDGAAAFTASSRLLVLLLGGLILGFVAAEWYGRLAPTIISAEEPSAWLWAAFIFTIFMALPFSNIPNRASLHRDYRDRLVSCFSVVRGADGVSPDVTTGVPLSELAPPASGDFRHPQLLIGATANVRTRFLGRRATFVPFELSHDYCEVPGDPLTRLSTRKLELLRVPGSLWHVRWRSPRMSLFDAVAITGAAVAPSMGRLTIQAARPFIAVLNLRWGCWIPNAFSARQRRDVEDRTVPGHKRSLPLGPGWDELVPEMLGLDGPRMHLSDGGHYNTLGLMTLLRRQCREIVCVDCSADPHGTGLELRRVIELAKTELNVAVELDLSVFQPDPAGNFAATHAVGSIRYSASAYGRLIVIKLGLSATSPAELHERAGTDHRFPHDRKSQAFRSDRMAAYRDLGADSATRCLNQLDETRRS